MIHAIPFIVLLYRGDAMGWGYDYRYGRIYCYSRGFLWIGWSVGWCVVSLPVAVAWYHSSNGRGGMLWLVGG